MKKYLSIFFCLILFFAYQTSWLTKPQSWEDASGWNSVSKTLKQKHLYDNNNQSLPKIFWLGHSGFLIEWHNTRFLLDPNLSKYSVIVHREAEPFISSNQLPEIDAAIISHAHYDHLDLPTLENIPKINNVILAKGSENFLSQKVLQKSKILGLNVWESTKIKDIEIISLPAVHNGSRNHPFNSSYSASGYLISDGNIKIYFAGDTGWGSHFEEIKKRYKPQISIIPIGGFEPYLILKNYHLDPEDAAKAANEIGSEISIPSHFGTFRVALEYPSTALPRFIEACEKLKVNWQIALPYKP